MIVKNFLKTAVLGVALCSTFVINNSMAMDNDYNQQQMDINNNYNHNNNEQYKNILRTIIEDLSIDSKFCGDFRLTENLAMDFGTINKQG